MPRLPRLADTLTKARKRLNRYADRLRSQASELSGSARQFLESEAQRVKDYARRFTMKNLRNEYSGDDIAQAVQRFEHDSTHFLTKASQAAREEELGDILVSNKDIASRFYAATIDIWRGKTGVARDKAILEFFGKDNLYQVMQELAENTGVDILQESDAGSEFYTQFIDAARDEIAVRMALG